VPERASLAGPYALPASLPREGIGQTAFQWVGFPAEVSWREQRIRTSRQETPRSRPLPVRSPPNSLDVESTRSGRPRWRRVRIIDWRIISRIRRERRLRFGSRIIGWCGTRGRRRIDDAADRRRCRTQLVLKPFYRPEAVQCYGLSHTRHSPFSSRVYIPSSGRIWSIAMPAALALYHLQKRQ
jgi:hypothetical protein